MHIGREDIDNGKSKTEAMFFPKSLQPDLYNHKYINKKVTVTDGYVTYTRKFQYLGSWITEDLRDDTDTEICIQKAAKALGKIRRILHDHHTSIRTKRLMFEAAVTNTLIWGCESWTMAESNRRKLDAFHHNALRQVFNISMHDVKDYSITNTQLRAWFDSARTPSEIITRRQAQWISRLATRALEDHPTPQLLLSWTDNPRKPGHPQRTFRHAYASTLATILHHDEEWEKMAKAPDWLTTLADESDTTGAIGKWMKTTEPKPDEPLPLAETLKTIKERHNAWRAEQWQNNGHPNDNPQEHNTNQHQQE